MFEIGDYVVCGNNGVCMIKEITTLRMGNVDKNRKYYILKPIYAEASTVYIPVDALHSNMRKTLTHQEADTLLESVSDIETLAIRDEKAAESQYKQCLQANNCADLLKLWKTLYYRRKLRLEKGHKVTAIDSRYHKIVEESLCGELALALGMSRDEVGDRILSKIETDN